MKQQISILIPVYNRCSTTLVAQLTRQAQRIDGLQYEIIIADDASTDKAIEKENRLYAGTQPHIHYIRQETNKGRSAIRNFLARQGKYRWLLFLDCHVEITNSNFLKNYLDTPDKYDVVCGGVQALPSAGCHHLLRYRYESSLAKKFSAKRRTNKPYQSFRTTNFLISKDAMLRHPFDEKIKKYGYEDVVFGHTLEEKKVPVLHIENAVAYKEYESNAIYLAKIEEAMDNLHTLSGTLYSYSPLVRAERTLEQFHLKTVARRMSPLLLPIIKRQLLGRHPSVKLFQLYKLAYYIQVGH